MGQLNNIFNSLRVISEGSNYNTTCTSTYWVQYNAENGNTHAAPSYRGQSNFHKSQGTDFQRIMYQQNNDNQT